MAKAEIHQTLPDISKFELVVNPPLSSNEVAVEIFASVEKAGKGFDGWMVEVANDFNRSNLRLSNGHIAKVKIRAIASGEAYQFIAAQKYLPDAYSPSHALWIQMLAARNIPLIPITERLLGNTAGIAMKERVQQTLQEKYGTLGVRQVIDAVTQGSITMGYTDPFVSQYWTEFPRDGAGHFGAGGCLAHAGRRRCERLYSLPAWRPICRAYDPPDARLCTTRWVIRGIRHGACYLCQDARVPVGLYLHPLWHPAR